MTKNPTTRKSAAVATVVLAAVWAALGGARAQPVAGPFDISPNQRADACDPNAVQLRVTVDGLDASGGILVVDLYRNDPDSFLNKKGRLRRVRLPAEVYEEGKGSQSFCLNEVAPGTYAMSSYHDQDADFDLDKKWNLMPKEPFALSNDPKLELGFPPIEPSLFRVGPRGGEVTLRLRTADER